MLFFYVVVFGIREKVGLRKGPLQMINPIHLGRKDRESSCSNLLCIKKEGCKTLLNFCYILAPINVRLL